MCSVEVSSLSHTHTPPFFVVLFSVFSGRWDDLLYLPPGRPLADLPRLSLRVTSMPGSLSLFLLLLLASSDKKKTTIHDS